LCSFPSSAIEIQSKGILLATTKNSNKLQYNHAISVNKCNDRYINFAKLGRGQGAGGRLVLSEVVGAASVYDTLRERREGGQGAGGERV
jgi:hypothetical protein